MLTQKISPHLKKLVQKSPAVRRQFIVSPKDKMSTTDDEEVPPPLPNCFIDPLLEDRFEPVKGLLHKYQNRVLVLLTLACAAYCRFCTRQRKVSEIKKGQLTKTDIDRIIEYVKNRPVIKEVIFSGGDPLVVPKTLIYTLNAFSNLNQITVIRIGTRVPVSSPDLINSEILKTIHLIKKPIYIGIHFEHPDELTPQTIAACQKLRRAGAILYSQSVFLKGVNDNEYILYNLFSRLIEIGIKPYYIYHCDPVAGAENFRVPVKKEIAIMTNLRCRLSGMAWPNYVIDTPNGSGKIPVPLGFWQCDTSSFTDFLGEQKKII